MDSRRKKVKYQLTVSKYSTDDYLDNTFYAMNTNTTFKGVLNHDTDKDCMTFKTGSKDSYYSIKLKVNGEAGWCNWELYSDRELTQKIDGNYTSVDRSEEWDMAKKLKPNTTYYIRISGETDKFKVNTYEVTVNNYGTDDHKDSKSSLTAINVGTAKSGYLNHNTDEDYYTFKTDKTDSFYNISFKVTGEEGWVYYEIFKDKEMTEQIETNACNYLYTKSSNTWELLKSVKPNKTYYIRVHGNVKQYKKNKYTITINKVKDDVGDTVKNAKTLALNNTYNGKAQAQGDVDLFKVTTSNYTKYRIIARNTSNINYLHVQVYGNKDLINPVAEYNYIGQKSAVNAQYADLNLTPYKTYYIRVYCDKNVKYTIGLQAKAPAAQTQQLVKKNKKISAITVTIGTVKKATGYEIYRAAKNGNFKKVKTVNSKTTKWVDKSVKKGSTYKYKVRAYAKVKGKTYYSAFSAIKSVKVK